MKIKKQKGYTLLELMMVIAIMAMISITVMQDRVNEVTHLKAKTLGVEIGNFASGLGSYVDYYSGKDPADYAPSPNNGDNKTGVNWLKSDTCDPSSTTSTGQSEIGFIPSCEYLSHTTNPALDQKTTYGQLGFSTTFIRDNSLPEPFRLEAITTLDSLIDPMGNRMDGEMGLAATVAGGIRLNTPGGVSAVPHVVVYCITKNGGNGLYNKICSNGGDNTGKIGIYVGQDAAASPFLRTDGGNAMQARIRFDENITDHLDRTIENLAHIQLMADDYDNNGVDDPGLLTIGEDLAAPIFSLDSNALEVVTQSTVNFKTPEVKVATGGYLIAENGYIHAAKGSITSGRSVEAPVFLPATDADGYGNGSVVSGDPSAIDPTADIGYKLVIDGDSELNNIGAKTISFGDGATNTSRVSDAKTAKISNNIDGGNLVQEEMRVTANELNLTSISGNPFMLTGDMNVGEFNVEMTDGSFKPLSELLPRYTFLGAQSIETYGGSSATVQKSPYITLGCRNEDLKIIVTPQSAFVSGIQHTTAKWVEIDWIGVQAAQGYTIGGGKTYQLDDPTRGLSYGNLIVDVNDNGSSWSVKIDTTAASDSGVGDSSYVNSYRGGNALAQVYCLNNIMR